MDALVDEFRRTVIDQHMEKWEDPLVDKQSEQMLFEISDHVVESDGGQQYVRYGVTSMYRGQCSLVYRRYSEFRSLASLFPLGSPAQLNFPLPSSLIGMRNLNDDFISQRKAALMKWMVVAVEATRQHLSLRVDLYQFTGLTSSQHNELFNVAFERCVSIQGDSQTNRLQLLLDCDGETARLNLERLRICSSEIRDAIQAQSSPREFVLFRESILRDVTANVVDSIVNLGAQLRLDLLVLAAEVLPVAVEFVEGHRELIEQSCHIDSLKELLGSAREHATLHSSPRLQFSALELLATSELSLFLQLASSIVCEPLGYLPLLEESVGAAAIERCQREVIWAGRRAALRWRRSASPKLFQCACALEEFSRDLAIARKRAVTAFRKPPDQECFLQGSLLMGLLVNVVTMSVLPSFRRALQSVLPDPSSSASDVRRLFQSYHVDQVCKQQMAHVISTVLEPDISRFTALLAAQGLISSGSLRQSLAQLEF